MEGSALCLVFCSTLAALVSVIPVLCSLILHSLRGWVLWEPLDSLLLIELLQQGPNLVLHLPNNLSLFPLGFRSPRVIFILNPRASAPLSVGPTCQPPVATRGNSGLAYRKFGQSEFALRTRYVQLLSGFVGTFGRCCWFSFTLSKCLVAGIPSMIGSSR